MTDEFYKAMAIILPSFFALITAILVVVNGRASKDRGLKQQDEIKEVHKLINSGLTVRIEEAKEVGVKTGIILEKEKQEKKIEDKKP